MSELSPNQFEAPAEIASGEGVLGASFFRTIEGVDPALLSVMDEEYAKVLAGEAGDEDVSPTADFRIKENAGYEDITHDESIREFVGSVISPEKQKELTESVVGLSPEDQEAMLSYAEDFFDVAILANAQGEGAHLSKISTITSVAESMDPVESVALPDIAQYPEEADATPRSINANLEKAKQIFTTLLAGVSAAVALQAPAFAGDRHNRGRQQFEQQAKVAVFNGLFSGVQGELAKRGIYINGGSPIPMPGAQFPVYSGGGTHSGGYEMGGGMSVEQSRVMQQIQSYQQHLQRNHVSLMKIQNEVEKWCGLASDYPRDMRWAQSCANAVARRDAMVNEKARIVNEIGRLQQELRYTR